LSEDDLLLASAKKSLGDAWIEDRCFTAPAHGHSSSCWPWYSSFFAIGYARFNTTRAIREMRTVFSGQLANGMLPSVIFNASCASNNSNTSAIINPPIQAYAISLMYNTTKARCQAKGLAQAACPDLENMNDFVQEVYPSLKRWHNYLRNKRDVQSTPFNQTGLIFIQHPWESTMEDSPIFNSPLLGLGLMEGDNKITDRAEIQRLARSCFLTNETARAYWQSSESFNRALRLLKRIEQATVSSAADDKPSQEFMVLDVLVNSVYSTSNQAMQHLAQVAGAGQDSQAWGVWAEQTNSRMNQVLYKRWYDNDVETFYPFYYDYNAVTRQVISIQVASGLTAFLANATAGYNPGARSLVQPGGGEQLLLALTWEPLKSTSEAASIREQFATANDVSDSSACNYGKLGLGLSYDYLKRRGAMTPPLTMILPTLALHHPLFNSGGAGEATEGEWAWRGAVWPHINWLAAQGFSLFAQKSIIEDPPSKVALSFAKQLRKDTLNRVRAQTEATALARAYSSVLGTSPDAAQPYCHFFDPRESGSTDAQQISPLIAAITIQMLLQPPYTTSSLRTHARWMPSPNELLVCIVGFVILSVGCGFAMLRVYSVRMHRRELRKATALSARDWKESHNSAEDGADIPLSFSEKKIVT
jgi:hypothetical protein